MGGKRDGRARSYKTGTLYQQLEGHGTEECLPLSEVEARVVGIYKIAAIVSAMPVSLSWKF